jgi:sugar phosphate isomerase/epimerase
VQLAAHTYTFRDRPLEAALDAVSALGIAAVEIWAGHVSDAPETAAAALSERGLYATAVGVGGFYECDDQAFDRVVSLARAVRAHVLVMCLAPKVIAWAAASVPDDLTLCVENHWDQPLARSHEVLAAIVAAPSLQAALDTGHALLAGEHPEAAVAALGARLGHVHLKDADRPSPPVLALGRRGRQRFLERPRSVMPGDGSLDIGALRAALVTAGFAGTVSLEHEGSAPERALERLLADWSDAC